jgi:hypothetical protein
MQSLCTQLTTPCQIFDPVADGQFLTLGHHHPHILDRPLIRVQSPSWYFRSIYGRRGCFRSDGGNHSQSNVSVSESCDLGEYRSEPDTCIRNRANPTASYFASCAPDQPCITPGTYAFLGAAAALGYVTSVPFYHRSVLTGAIQWHHEDHGHRGRHHVRVDWGFDLYPADDGETLDLPAYPFNQRNLMRFLGQFRLYCFSQRLSATSSVVVACLTR